MWWKLYNLKMYKTFPFNHDLSHLIGVYIDRFATDPHETIYSLLGMLPSYDYVTKIEADYRKTVEEVVQRIMEYLIAKEDTIHQNHGGRRE